MQRNSPCALQLLEAFPGGSIARTDGDLPVRCVHGKGSWALDGFIQDCLTHSNLAGSSFPTLHSYKTGRDDQQ